MISQAKVDMFSLNCKISMAQNVDTNKQYVANELQNILNVLYRHEFKRIITINSLIQKEKYKQMLKKYLIDMP